MIEEVYIKKYAENEVAQQKDAVIKERRANIFVNGEHYISLMCLPQHLEELAVGFLFSEGLIASYADVQKIEADCADNVYAVVGNSPENAKTAKRAMLSGFAQGSVNLPFFESESLPPCSGAVKISPAEVIKMATTFNKSSELFKKTGAVHSSALILPDGTELFYEDIGRHNAIDKIIGKALMSGLCLKDGILLTSGRISSEILLKTARLGVPAIISTSAPTDMAVQAAQKLHMTLIGFARGRSFNVYAGEVRIG